MRKNYSIRNLANSLVDKGLNFYYEFRVRIPIPQLSQATPSHPQSPTATPSHSQPLPATPTHPHPHPSTSIHIHPSPVTSIHIQLYLTNFKLLPVEYP